MKFKITYSILLIACFVSVSFSAPAKMEYPQITEVVLDNGLKVMLANNTEQPAVFYNLVVSTGKIDNPLDKSGLSQLTSRLLTESTKLMSAGQIAETLAKIGASLNINTRWQQTYLNINVLKQYSDIGLDIIINAASQPVFKPAEFKRIKNEFITTSKMNLENNGLLAFAHGSYLLMGSDSPLGFTKTSKSLKRISLKDVKQFHQNNFIPNNSILFVIGDFSKEQMLEKIKQKTADWQSSSKPIRPEIKMDITTKSKIRIVNKPGMTQTVIFLNNWAIKSNSPEYYQYQLTNYILGGSGFASRLMDAVRCQGGKTYGIGSQCYLNLDYGFSIISTSTRNQEFYNTYQIIDTELKKIIASGFTAEELQKAKSYMAGAIPIGLESPGAFANKILNSMFAGLTIEDLENEIINYDSVTLDQINAVAKKYLSIKNMNLVVVADAEKIKDQLKKLSQYQLVYYKDELMD